jgi:hypothetical protein
MRIDEATRELSEFTRINKREIKYLIESDYFRSFKSYDEVPKDSFVAKMQRKYKRNESLHYGDTEYLIACLFFYKVNVRKCLNIFRHIYEYKEKELINRSVYSTFNNPSKVIDLGAGIGISTLDMKRDLFPYAKVYYHNLVGQQWVFAKKLFAHNKLDVKMVQDYSTVGATDIVFAFDYFEHFYKPIVELANTLNYLKPKYIMETTDFTHAFIGHFPEYNILLDGKDELIRHKKTRTYFSEYLLSNGYMLHPISATFWNGEPRIWQRVKQ